MLLKKSKQINRNLFIYLARQIWYDMITEDEEIFITYLFITMKK